MGELKWRGKRAKGFLYESHPNQSGAKYEGAERRRRSSLADQPVSEDEPRAINCAQCGHFIEDYAAISTCPLCEGDNFLGLPVTNY